MAKTKNLTPDEIMEMIKQLPTSDQLVILRNLKEVLSAKAKEAEEELNLINGK